MNTAIGPPSHSEHVSGLSKERMREVNGKILDLLLQLIKHRPDMEVTPTHQSHKWNLINKQDILLADGKDDELLPLHNCIKLLPFAK